MLNIFLKIFLKMYWHIFSLVREYRQGDEEKSTLKGKRREFLVGEKEHWSLREYGLLSFYYDE